MADKEALEEFIAIELHNEQVRKNLKKFMESPEREKLADCVNYDLSTIKSIGG